LSYRWSSVLVYSDAEAAKSFVDQSLVLNLLSDDRQESVAKYRTLLERGAGMDTGHVLEQQDAIDRFRAMVVEIFPRLFKRMVWPRQVARVSSGGLLNLEELERQIEAVRNNPKRSPETRAARKFLIEQMMARGFKRDEIAERLQMSPKTIYNILKKPLLISARSDFR
jgi:putative transposase